MTLIFDMAFSDTDT